MTPLVWLGAALAGGLHTGIPVTGLPVLGEPTFEGEATGWRAPLVGHQSGFALVYVGRTEADAMAWTDRALQSLTLVPSPAPLVVGDVSVGDGDALLLFRDGNVGVLVRAPSGALDVARALHAAIVDDHSPWPDAPHLVVEGDHTRVVAPGAVYLATEGGSVVPFKPGLYTTPPTSAVAWDAFGRAVSAQL